MNKFIITITLIFSFIFLASCQTPAYALGDNSDRIIVKFRSFVSETDKSNLLKSHGLSISERLRLADTFVLKVPKNKTSEFATRLGKSALVEYAEEDGVAQALEVPNDPYYPNQWGLSKIDADLGWNVTHGASSTLIAIADTGIDGTHPDLGSKIVQAVDCTNSCVSVSAQDGNGHGTHVAGIASAVTNNGQGVAGLGYDTSLASVQVLDAAGSGYYSWVANGIIWAADNGAEVINLSLGGTSSSSTLRQAVEYAWNKGVVVVAAAGNSSSTRRHYPAYYSQAIAVAATNQSDSRAYFSTYGSWVDVAAPGQDIFSTYPGGYTNLSGTSMATPFVSGLAGLLFSYHPGWTNSQVRSQIEGTADKITGTGTYWKYGRINVCKALDCTISASPSPSPTLTPTPTPGSSPSPTPTPTATPSPTPSSTPTPTPTPSTSPSPTPSPTPTPWWCITWPFLCS